MITGLRPELDISQSGDTFCLKMITPHVTKEVTFKNGDTVEQTSVVGKTVKVWVHIFHVAVNKLFLSQFISWRQKP